MRIVIEMDGIESRVSSGSAEPAQREVGAADGGAGPGGEGASSAAPEMDSGGPPQALLDAITAAEAAEMQGAGDEAGAADAGAGPSGQ
jgi:hypothetical protein